VSDVRNGHLRLVHEHEARAETELTLVLAQLEHLSKAMRTRAPIEQAKGALMARYGIDADDAFHVLMHWSQTDAQVRVVAGTVMDLLSGDTERYAAESDFQLALSQALRTTVSRLDE